MTPDPVVRLQLRHRDHDLGLAQDARHPELAQPRVAGLERRSHERRVVEVDEPQTGVVERVAQAGGERDRLRVTAMTRPLGHDDRGSTEPPECVRGGHHHPRVGVDRRALDELDEVRLEQDALAPHVRVDEPEPVEHDRFEVAVVAPRTEHGNRGAPGLRELPTIEAGRLVERAHPIRDEGRTGPDPQGGGTRPHDELLAGHAHARDLRGSSLASGPVASAAQATARGLSRNEGRREIDSSAARSSGTLVAAPVEAVRDERLRDREPAGLEAPVVCEEPERARDDPGVTLLERDQAHRGRLRVAAQVDVVHGGVAEVPAAVRALARAQEPDRLAPRSRIVRRQSVHGEEHARGGLGERAGVDGPAPGRPRSGSGALGSGRPRWEIAYASARRASRRSASARAPSAELVGPSSRPSFSSKPPSARSRAASHARAGASSRASAATAVGSTSETPVDADRQTAVGRAELGERADERCVEAGGAHHVHGAHRARCRTAREGSRAARRRYGPGPDLRPGRTLTSEADDSRYSPERGGNGGPRLRGRFLSRSPQGGITWRQWLCISRSLVGRLRERQEGQTMAEYALILGGIAVVVIAGILILGPAISDLFSSTGSSVHELPELLATEDRPSGPSIAPAPGLRSAAPLSFRSWRAASTRRASPTGPGPQVAPAPSDSSNPDRGSFPGLARTRPTGSTTAPTPQAPCGSLRRGGTERHHARGGVPPNQPRRKCQQ